MTKTPLWCINGSEQLRAEPKNVNSSNSSIHPSIHPTHISVSEAQKLWALCNVKYWTVMLVRATARNPSMHLVTNYPGLMSWTGEDKAGEAPKILSNTGHIYSDTTDKSTRWLEILCFPTAAHLSVILGRQWVYLNCRNGLDNSLDWHLLGGN